MVNFCVVVGCTNNMKKCSHLSCRWERLRGKQEATGCMASKDTQTGSLRLSSEASISLRVTVVCKCIDFNFCSFLLTLVHLSPLSLMFVLYPKFSNSTQCIQLGWSHCDVGNWAHMNGCITLALHLFCESLLAMHPAISCFTSQSFSPRWVMTVRRWHKLYLSPFFTLFV